MKRLVTLSILVVLIIFVFCMSPCFSQSSGDLEKIKEDIKFLKDSQKAIQKDLQEIKKLLASRPAAQPAEFKETIIDIKGDPFQGDANAKLAFVEFSDYV